MVALFVRLKWALTTSRIRASSPGSQVSLAVGLAVGVLVSVGIGFGLAALRWRPDNAAPVIGAVFSAQFVAWMLAPFLAFGIDDTIDPRRFVLLPIGREALRRGLAASAVIGYLPLFNVLMLIGAAIGLSTNWERLPLAVVCCAVQLLMCVVFSRAASTSMAALLASRRGRDIGMLIGMVLLGAYFAFIITVDSGVAGPDASTVTTVLGVLRYGPPGALAHIAMLDGVVFTASAIVGVALFIGLGWTWWGIALSTAMTTNSSTTAGSGVSTIRPGGRAVATTQWRAACLVAERDLRLIRRDPARLMPWAMVAMFGIAWPFVVQGGGAFAVMLAALMVGGQVTNFFCVEGSGVWLHLVCFSDQMRARGEVLGHALAALLPGALIIAVGITVQVVARGGAGLVPAAAGVCFAGLLGAVGASCRTSATHPFPMPRRRTSAFASAVSGYKGRAMGAAFIPLGIGIVTALPAIAMAVLAVVVAPLWGYVGIVAALVTGGAVLAIGVRAGARRYVERAPEILAVASLGDRA